MVPSNLGLSYDAFSPLDRSWEIIRSLFIKKLCFSGKIKKDAKFFMTNKRQKSKSGSVSEDPNLEMQTGEPTKRGYAFSLVEHGLSIM